MRYARAGRGRYWTQRRLGSGAWLALLDDIVTGAFGVEDLVLTDYRRVYADAEIGFVDAAVLAITERLGEPKLATLDRRHFGTRRPRHVDALTLLPSMGPEQHPDRMPASSLRIGWGSSAGVSGVCASPSASPSSMTATTPTVPMKPRASRPSGGRSPQHGPRR